MPADSQDRASLFRHSAADRLPPCCEETTFASEGELEAAAVLAQAVREFLAGTPYRHGSPTPPEKDALAKALGAYERETRC